MEYSVAVPPRQTLGGKFAGISMTNCPTLQTIEAFYTKNGLPINKDKTFDYDERYEYISAPENCDENNYEDLVKYAIFTPSSDKVMRLCTDREPRFMRGLPIIMDILNLVNITMKKLVLIRLSVLSESIC